MQNLIAPDNPFSTRHVRPGAIPYDVGSGSTLADLVAQLRRQGWWGEIIGPHGVGKTTMLASLVPLLEAAGRRVVQVALHDGQRRAPRQVSAALRTSTASDESAEQDLLIVVDGYEQLGRFARALLRWRCRRRGAGLLATAHGPLGLPPLARLSADGATIGRLVARLLGGQEGLIGPGDIAAVLAGRQDDVREMLFDLYKLYEQRRPCEPYDR